MTCGPRDPASRAVDLTGGRVDSAGGATRRHISCTGSARRLGDVELPHGTAALPGGRAYPGTVEQGAERPRSRRRRKRRQVTAPSAGGPPRIRVLIADDQALLRRGLALMLSVEPDMEVVGQACDGAQAVEMAQQMHPDVVLMDLHMPRKGGVAATREITVSLPRTQVLVLTTLDAEETVFEAIRAGARAYLLKDAT